MVLVSDEISDACLVVGGVASSRRSTTYDATIGEFILEGTCLEGDKYVLPPRGVVWVVSHETFKFGGTHTGLATLKTSLTHKGILALNVGIIDPGWEGPLATALVNFSGSAVELKRRNAFFRIMFMQHRDTHPPVIVKTKDEYTEEILDRSRYFSATFLNTHALVDEVSTAVFKLPKIAVAIGWAGLALALAAIFIALAAILIPITWDVWQDHKNQSVAVRDLQKRIERLELPDSKTPPPNRPDTPINQADVKGRKAGALSEEAD